MRATWPGLRIGNRSLNSIRLWMLTSSIVVATSALSGQAATAKQSSTDSKVFGAVQRPSVDDSADIASSQRYGMRSLTLDPGSAVILRGDKGRPTLVHVIKGTLTSHPQDMPEVVLHAGDGYAGIEDSECLIGEYRQRPSRIYLAAGVSVHALTGSPVQIQINGARRASLRQPRGKSTLRPP